MKNKALQLPAGAWLIIVVVLVAVNIFTISKLPAKSCGGYSYINPIFECGHKITIDKKEYSELRAKLESFVETKKSEGRASIIGIWFRDLEGGPTFGINERTDFVPASLLKLPLALTFLQLAEEDPGILRQNVTYQDTTASVPSQAFPPSDPILKNRVYTIQELIFHAIVHSDNVASQLLFDYLNTHFKDKPLSQTYRDLGILEPGTDLNLNAVNTKEYGSIFRQLYNVSFLGKNFSEILLSLLVQSEFRDGLRRGVPAGTVVANKFGERFLANGEKQLHDCGIVYYPGNPYELCVMTRGNNFNDLSDIIGQISKEVYQEFDSRKL